MASKSTAKRAPAPRPERQGQTRPGPSRQKKSLPEVPDKLYYRIGEVARLCAVETYVLRFWETEFPQLKPNKSGAGQRLYRRREVDLARHIRHLLYEECYTIPGARQAIQSEARKPAETAQLPLVGATGKNGGAAPRLGRLRTELKEILGMLSTTPDGRGSKTGDGVRSARRETRQERRGPELFD